MTSFFSKLLPLEGLFSFGPDAITAYGILFIIGIFCVFVYKLTRRIGRLTRSIQRCSDNFSEERVAKDSVLRHAWHEYRSTFHDSLGYIKTDVHAYEYFNSKSLFLDGANLSLIHAGPNILTGLGVLGTFVGLTMGISDFNTESTETIKDSIQMLLSGMGSAFATSIWGMGFSLILTYIEKSKLNQLSLSIHAFTSLLDKQYKMTKQEERMVIVREQGEIFARIFTNNDSQGGSQSFLSILGGIHQEMRSLRKELKENEGTEHQETIQALKDLQSEIVSLAHHINAPAAEMTLQIVEELKKSLAVMMDDFHNTLSSSALSELDELAKTLSAAGKNMSELPQRMEALSANLDVTFGNLRQLLATLSESSLGQQVDTVKQTQLMLREFTESLSRFEHMNRKVEQSVLRISHIQEHVAESCNTMRDFGTFMRKSSDSFLISQESFHATCDQFLKENNKVISEITSLVHITAENSRENEVRFENIRHGLEDIFSGIEQGLVQYQGTVGSSIRAYLSEFTQHLTSATSSLASESSKQADLLEELNEILSKIKR